MSLLPAKIFVLFVYFHTAYGSMLQYFICHNFCTQATRDVVGVIVNEGRDSGRLDKTLPRVLEAYRFDLVVIWETCDAHRRDLSTSVSMGHLKTFRGLYGGPRFSVTMPITLPSSAADTSARSVHGGSS